MVSGRLPASSLSGFRDREDRRLPGAKSRIAWRDEDSVFVGTDFGPGSLTDSGYSRVAKEWRRGTPLASATTV